MAQVGDLTIPAMQDYASKHGYDFYHMTDIVTPTDNLCLSSWKKIDVCCKLLEELGYDWVLWLDSDILIIDPSKDILDEVRTDHVPHFVYSEHHTPWFNISHHPNGGMFLVRTASILRDIERIARTATNGIAIKVWEQCGMMALCGIDYEGFESRRPYKVWDPKLPVTHGYQMQCLGHEWNFSIHDQRDPPKIIRFAHYCGMNNSERVRQISNRIMWNSRSYHMSLFDQPVDGRNYKIETIKKII